MIAPCSHAEECRTNGARRIGEGVSWAFNSPSALSAVVDYGLRKCHPGRRMSEFAGWTRKGHCG